MINYVLFCTLLLYITYKWTIANNNKLFIRIDLKTYLFLVGGSFYGINQRIILFNQYFLIISTNNIDLTN